MSAREWNAGDVALHAGERVVWTDRGQWIWATTGRPCLGQSYANAEARPLVVIDPEDREQVERLVELFVEREGARHGRLSPEVVAMLTEDLRDALREFANPTPPKPDEPTGLGAVVEDADEVRWLCNRFDPKIPWSTPWFSSDLDEWREYADINAVRVLSEGVTA